MKLQRLRALRALMETGSVTKAADAMSLTQPAVSRLISGLEADIGFALFVREQGRLLPTSEGEIFFQRVEHALAGVDDLSRIASEIGSYREGSIVLLCTPQAGYTVFPVAIGRFSKKYPRIKINLQIVQRREVGVASRSMHYDMGFTAIPFDFPNLAVRRTFTMPARALIPTSHRLATRRAISIRDFEGENLIMLTKDNSIRPKLELELLKANISFASTMETSSPIVAYKLVSQGLGLSVVDPFSPMVMNSDEVANLRLNGDISLTYGFFFPERKPVSRLCEDFMLILGDIVQAYGQN